MPASRLFTSLLPNRRDFLKSTAGLSSAGALLLFSPGTSAAAAAMIPAQKQTYVDPSTEFLLTRWTEEGASAQIPAEAQRAIPKGDGRMLYASDRSGSWQPYVLQLPKGDSVQLTETEHLHPGSLTFLGNGKELLYLDGNRLVRTQTQRNRARTIYEARDGWDFTGEMRVSSDDRSAALVEAKGGDSRVLLADLVSGKTRTLFTIRQGVARLLVLHPQMGVLVANSEGKASFQGGAAGRKADAFPDGQVLDAHLDRQGRKLTYLIRSTGPQERVQLMDLDLQTGVHSPIANTSKFATFVPNGDGSVFVGASSSVAQPYLLLLLRVTRREMALVEHSASAAHMVRPMFSNDSETLFFQSDRLGKNIIFSLNLKGLVEKT